MSVLNGFLLKNKLQSAMEARNCTVEDIKMDALLALVHNLLKQYLYAEENKLSKLILKDDTNRERKKFIIETAKAFYDYLDNKEGFFSVEKMREILENKSNNQGYKILGIAIEPISYFYDALVIEYQKNFKALLKQDDGINSWMPDLLAFRLITDLIELAQQTTSNAYSNYKFDNYSFIRDYDYTKVLETYSQFSSEDKKQALFKSNNVKKKDSSKNRSLISKTNIISLNMLKVLKNTKYIAETIQKPKKTSKTRNKKNKKNKKR